MDLNEFKNIQIYTSYFGRIEYLKKLNPEKVRKELGNKAVLLCYEKPGQFCHRRIVAKWFEDKLGIEVKEI